MTVSKAIYANINNRDYRLVLRPHKKGVEYSLEDKDVDALGAVRWVEIKKSKRLIIYILGKAYLAKVVEPSITIDPWIEGQ